MISNKRHKGGNKRRIILWRVQGSAALPPSVDTAKQSAALN